MGFWGKLIHCKNHKIGNNKSKEVYIWKGRESIPLWHYIEFECENCGRECKMFHDDAKYGSKEYEE